jgi:hypothetical protein
MRRVAVPVLSGLLFVSVVATACADSPDLAEQQRAVSSSSPQAVKSQLRGYDLGPPFPAGFRDSGLVNGYAEGEWVPFVAVLDGKKLANADTNEGAAGDGVYRVGIIVPTYSPRHDANGISELAVVGTYGQGAILPIPQPFDDRWLVDHGYAPFVLGAYADSGEIDAAPVVQGAAQRTGPRRFGGQVSSVSVSVRFTLTQPSTHVELRFAVRLAPPGLQAIEPNGQAFAGDAAGSALGAADYFPGPGPLFVGYEVGDPTGIATVPIRVERNHCESSDDCVPGDECSPGGNCEHPCVTDANCPGGELCEDGVCSPPPPPCTSDRDCNGDTCVGGFCLPECPPATCNDPEFCDPDPCVPPGGGGGDGGSTPCVLDSQCPSADVCEDGVCQPPTPPCDVSCPEELSCEGGTCVPSTPPCSSDANCPGGSACVEGTCRPSEPPCSGPGCDTCSFDQDCPGGQGCSGGACHPLTPPVPCSTSASCSGGQTCEGGFCTPPTYCGPGGTCPVGELCENHPGGRSCVPPSCTTASDCGAGESCVGGSCTPPGGCTGDFDCPGGELCGSGHCVPGQPPVACTSSASDCPVGGDDVGLPTCEGGFCTPGGGACGNDPDCPGGFVCELGKCVGGGGPQPCAGSFDCASGETCQGGFCVPGDGVGCRSNADCPANPNDDVPSVCVGGLCTGSSVVPSACQVATDCNPGNTCVAGACLAIPGACEVSGDCEAGSSCIAGWCGVACSDDASCDGGLCVEGRCETRCTAFSDCKAFQTCLGGACAPLYTTVAGPGKAGDEAFEVDFDEESGGCSVTGHHRGAGDGLLIVLALFVPLALRRSRRRHLAALAPLLGLALVITGCTKSDDGDDAPAADASVDESADADPSATPDAEPGESADADPTAPDAEPGTGGASDLTLITCAADPAPGAPADAAPGGPLDEPCCDPTGVCADGFLCIAGPGAQHGCRPPCDAQGQCGAGAVCAHFGATDVCIPASTEGQACAPELCEPSTICVGANADSATCHLRCTTSAECTAPATCQALVGSGAKACI